MRSSLGVEDKLDDVDNDLDMPTVSEDDSTQREILDFMKTPPKKSTIPKDFAESR